MLVDQRVIYPETYSSKTQELHRAPVFAGSKVPQKKREKFQVAKNSFIDPNPYHPGDWYIYLHEWLIFMVNVVKCS